MATTAAVGRARYVRILLLVCLAFAVCAIDRSNIAVAAPEIAKEFDLATVTVGVVLSAFFWGYVPVQIPGALFGQYRNAKWLIFAALVLWGLSTLLCGLSSGLRQLIAFRVLVGVSEGMAVPTLLILIRRWFPLEERARASSTFFIAGQAGNLVGTVLTGTLIAATGWRTMFFLEAVPPLLVAAGVAIWLADDPETDPRLGAAEREQIVRAREAEVAETGTVENVSWTTVLRSPLVWGFAVIWIMSSAGSYGLQTWVPTVAKEVTSLGILNVGLLSAIPYLVSIALLLVAGFASDRLRRRDAFIFGSFLIGGLALLIGPHLPGAVLKLVVIFLGAGANSAGTGIIIAWLGDLTPRAHVGLAIGIIQFCGQMSGIGAPLAVGIVAGTGQAVSGIWTIGAGLLVGAAVTLLIYLGARRRVERAPTPQTAVTG